MATRLPEEQGDARRAFERIPIDAEIEVIAPKRAFGIALNLSAGGLRLAVDARLAPGSLCLVRVRPAGSARAFVEQGRIVWTQDQPDGCVAGLAFSTTKLN